MGTGVAMRRGEYGDGSGRSEERRVGKSVRPGVDLGGRRITGTLATAFPIIHVSHRRAPERDGLRPWSRIGLDCDSSRN